ncbi:MAG TPA: transcription-repair coupling factor, partial [Propionibacteriaceae bacterium]|nr:transcription-repair coupling factor [Propionibacteriaceae bacterium]
MTLTGLVDLFCTEPTIAETIADARVRRLPVLDVTAPAPMRPLLAAVLSTEVERGGAGRPVLLVTSTFREAEELTAALQSVAGDEAVAYYPAWETLPHERLSPRSDTVGRRLELLRRLAGNGQLPAPRIVVAPVRSVLQPQVKGLGEMTAIRLAVGDDIDLTDLATALVEAAYTRVDLVERRGEFAVRGGIVDVFPPTEEHPVRIDFFGDTVEEIRYFSVADQRSSDIALTEITASPCRELLLTDEVRARAAELAVQHPELLEMLDKIVQGHPVDGMEALSPALVDGMELLIDLLPADTHVLISDPELVRGRAIELVKTSEEFLHASWAAAAGGGKAPIDLGASSYQPLAEVRAAALARGMAWWTLSPFSAGPVPDFVTDGVRNPIRTADGEIIDLSDRVTGPGVESRTVLGQVGETYRGDTEAAVNEITKRVRDGWRVVVTAEGRGTADRIVEVLGEHAVPVYSPSALDEPPPTSLATVVTGQLSHGFVADHIRLAVFTAGDLSGQRVSDRASRKMPARRKNQINPLELVSG